MKAHIGWVTTIEAMAVNTTLELGVLYQRTLIERGEIAFVNAHLAPHLVARLYQTVANSIVDAVWTDVNRERAIGVSTIGILGRNGNT